MAATDAAVAGWTLPEHATGKAALRAESLCPDALFDANVEFRLCDMNAIPPDLTGFDFCWSACALEHLGTIDRGLAFIERSLECLAPGGVAVHTTEFNVASDTDTLTSGPAVIFRRRDLTALRDRVLARGFDMARIDFDPGDRPLDRFIDMPAYLDQPHLKLALEGYVSTSIGLIITNPASAGQRPAK